MLDKNYNNHNIDIVTLSLLFNIIPISIFIYRDEYIFATLCILSTNFSFLYHVTYETSKLFLLLDATTSSMCFITFAIKIYNSIYTYYYYTLLAFSLLFYYIGSGRQHSEKRTQLYIVYHTLWHLCLSITGIAYGLLEVNYHYYHEYDLLDYY